MDLAFGVFLSSLFRDTTTNKIKQTKKGGSRSVNDLCIDVLEMGRQKLLSSPYTIPQADMRFIKKHNASMAKQFSLNPDYVQLDDFDDWQSVILPVRYVIQGKSKRIYYNLPKLIISILTGKLTHDPITGYPILSKRPDNITNHQTLYLQNLVEEHIRRQLSLAHHMFYWANENGKKDMTSFLLSNIPYVNFAIKGLKLGSTLVSVYKDQYTEEMITFDAPTQELDVDNIMTFARLVPSQKYLTPYKYIIHDASTREQGTQNKHAIPKKLMRIHRSAYRFFKSYMQKFRQPDDFLTSCRDVPLSPKGPPPSKQSDTQRQ